MTTATMTRTYASSEVRRLTGVTLRELEHWVTTGVITPSAEPTVTHRGPMHPSPAPLRFTSRINPGSGNSRRYTDDDVRRINALKLLRTAGVELGRLRHEDLSAVRADIEQAFFEAERVGLCE